MTEYYARVSGNNSNNGLTPGTAWRTLGKSLGTGTTTMLSGDILYVGPGVYREKVTLGLPAPTSTTLSGTVTASATSLAVASSSGFPAPPFYAMIEDEGSITSITAANPPVVTAAGHGLETGRRITIRGTTPSSSRSGGIGDYNFGTDVVTSTAHGLATGDRIFIYLLVSDIQTEPGINVTVTVTDANHFTIAGSELSNWVGTSYVTGGLWLLVDGINDTFYVTVLSANTFSVPFAFHTHTASGGTWRATLPEIVKVTAVNGTTWTIERGQHETTAYAHNSGMTIRTITVIQGDVLGTNTGDDPGEIRLTNYLTDDRTAPTPQNLMDMNGVDSLLFKKLTFLYTNNDDDTDAHVIVCPAVSQYVNIVDCSFIASVYNQNYASSVIRVLGAAATPLHWFLDRCYFFISGGPEGVIYIDYSQDAHSACVDADVIINNNVFIGYAPVVYFAAGPSTFPSIPENSAGGLVFWSNSILAREDDTIYILNQSTNAVAAKLYNNFGLLGSYYTFVNVNGCGTKTVVEDYNLIHLPNSVGLSNRSIGEVVYGEHSITDGSYAPLVHFGQELQQLQEKRPLFSPTADSPLLRFGNSQDAPIVDYYNRPRPGYLTNNFAYNAVGAFERHDAGLQSTGTYHTPPSALVLPLASDHDFYLPIITGSNEITVMTMYDDNSSDNPPQAQLLANPTIGVSSETLTAPTGTPNNWQQLVFSTVAPTNLGVLTLRFANRTPSGTGNAWFDTILVNGE